MDKLTAGALDEAFFRSMVDSLDMAVMVIDHDFKVVYANLYLCEKIAGMPQSDVIGMHLPRHHTVPDEDLQRVIDHTRRVLELGVAERIENWALCKDGSRRLLYWATVPQLNPDGSVACLVAAGMDVTEQRREKHLLQDMAHRDSLTNLHNRAYFEYRLPEEVACAERDRSGLALMYVDMDGFKPVNDGHGHEIGDMVLREVAQRLRKGLRQNDVVCRVGGDEFAIILPGVSSIESAAMLAEQVLKWLCQPYEVSQSSHILGASIGIAFWREGMRDVQELVRKADSAMYRAKQSGKGHFEFAE